MTLIIGWSISRLNIIELRISNNLIKSTKKMNILNSGYGFS